VKTKSKNVSEALGFPLSKTPKGTTEDYDEMWGLDPGQTDFITATNQDGKTVRFRTSNFYRASGYSRSNRKSKHRIDKLPGIRELLKNVPSKKTASVELFSKAIEYWFEHGSKLLSFFMDPFFRKLKFRRYTLRTAQLDRACFELAGAKGTKTIVGFGDSGTAGEGFIKRSVPGPVSREGVRAQACSPLRGRGGGRVSHQQEALRLPQHGEPGEPTRQAQVPRRRRAQCSGAQSASLLDEERRVWDDSRPRRERGQEHPQRAAEPARRR